MIYLVTGVLGGGKSLIAVSKIKEYLERGCRIVTNMDLFLEFLCDKDHKEPLVTRIPDFPNSDDLAACGFGYEGAKVGKFDDDKAGLMVLDEAATWLNARDYRDKDRSKFIKFVINLRKKGWHVLLLVQNEDMLDSQSLKALGEHIVYCQRLDRMKMPILGEWSKALGKKEIKPPKVHVGNVKYKTANGYQTVDTWYYQGHDLYDCYNTCQIYENEGDIGGVCTLLPAWYIYGRYTNDAEHKTRRLIGEGDSLPAQKSRPAFFTGMILAGVLSYMFLPAEEVVAQVSQQQSSNSEKPKPYAINPFDTLRITASVKSSRSFDYVFETDTGAFYPENIGYKVRYISDCKAQLYNANDTFYVTCASTRPLEAPARSREVSARSEGGLDVLNNALKPLT